MPMFVTEAKEDSSFTSTDRYYDIPAHLGDIRGPFFEDFFWGRVSKKEPRGHVGFFSKIAWKKLRKKVHLGYNGLHHLKHQNCNWNTKLGYTATLFSES